MAKYLPVLVDDQITSSMIIPDVQQLGYTCGASPGDHRPVFPPGQEAGLRRPREAATKNISIVEKYLTTALS